MQDLKVARRKTKLMQGMVERERVWGIMVVPGVSCYQMLVCSPSWEEEEKLWSVLSEGQLLMGQTK